jgi:hypothetical protein
MTNLGAVSSTVAPYVISGTLGERAPFEGACASPPASTSADQSELAVGSLGPDFNSNTCWSWLR